MAIPIATAIAGLSAIGSIGSLFKKNKPLNYEINDPATQGSGWAGYGENLDPVLQQLLASADHSQEQSWDSMNRQLADQYQSRGLGGSGIEFANQSDHLRKLLADIQAQKQARALEVYMAALNKLQSDRNFAVNRGNLMIGQAGQQAQLAQNTSANLGQQLGTLYGMTQQGTPQQTQQPQAPTAPQSAGQNYLPWSGPWTPAPKQQSGYDTSSFTPVFPW